MGLQNGIIKITGTIDNLTFYKMDGIYYVRKKSSLSRKKVLTAPSFKRTRMHAGEFKIASKIASRLYRPIKKEDKSIHLFRKMVGRAKTLLHKGNQIDQIILIITREMITPIKEETIKIKEEIITIKDEKNNRIPTAKQLTQSITSHISFFTSNATTSALWRSNSSLFQLNLISAIQRL